MPNSRCNKQVEMLGPFDGISVVSSCESYFSISCVRVLPYLKKKKKRSKCGWNDLLMTLPIVIMKKLTIF